MSMTTDHKAEPDENNRAERLRIDNLLTVEQVADYLNFTPDTIRNLARRGKLPAFKVGKEWRFSRASIDEFFHCGDQDKTS